MLFGKILTLPYQRSFGSHTAGQRPIHRQFHGNQSENG
jgi:hypothetical protein